MLGQPGGLVLGPVECLEGGGVGQKLELLLLVDDAPVCHLVVRLSAVQGSLRGMVCLKTFASLRQTNDKFAYPDHVLLHITPALEKDLDLVVGAGLLDS